MNLLGEEDNSPQLFASSRVRAAQDFAAEKEIDKEQHKKNMTKKKEESNRKNKHKKR